MSLEIDSGQREGGHGEKMFPRNSFGVDNHWEKVGLGKKMFLGEKMCP